MSAQVFAERFNPNRKAAPMAVDISKIRDGDEVLVRLIASAVRSDQQDTVWVNQPGAHPSDAMGVRAAAIVDHTARPLIVGEKVRCDGALATVLFTDAEDTVIRFDSGRGIHSGRTDIWARRKLERVS